MKISIIGLGQSLRGDDAIGLLAVQSWQDQFPQTASKPEIHIEISELPGLALLDLLDGTNAAIIVDSIQATAAPGTIVRIQPDELAAFTSDSQSAHGWGVAETIKMGLSLYPALGECRITLIGIVGKTYDMGAGMSSEVIHAIPQLCEMIETDIQALFGEQKTAG